MDTIQCKKCSRHMVPRLWHYHGGLGRYMRTQHICPFCGHVQYETGGHMKWWAKVLLTFLLAMIGLKLLASAFGLDQQRNYQPPHHTKTRH